MTFSDVIRSGTCRTAAAATLLLSGAAVVVAGLPSPPPSAVVGSRVAAGSGVNAPATQQLAIAASEAPIGVTPGAATTKPAPAPTPSRPAALPITKSTTPLAASRPTAVRIPDIGVSSTLVDLGLRDDRTIEVPTDFAVAGWYTLAPTPGEVGPAIILGHVDSRSGPAVFYRLGNLGPGDTVLVDRTDGVTAAFSVDRVDQYPKDAFPSEDVYGWVDRAELRLITCGGTFNHDTGHYVDNIVVYAHLIGTM